MSVVGHSGAAGSVCILDAACVSLSLCVEMLATLNSESYCRPSEHMLQSTIGQHVRHSVDHFASIVHALDGAVIDYDHRERGTPIERDRDAAIERLRSLSTVLATIDEERLSSSVRVRIMTNAAGTETELGSTLGRELAFATHHAIHHFAMIASIAAEISVRIPEGFGKAPSTAHYEARRRTKAGAP